MKYPNKIQKSDTRVINHANRGMTLEHDLNLTNVYYSDNNIAVITKKATPIKVLKIKNTCKGKTIINEACFETPSTTDYNGIYKGRYIDFEAKETKNKKAFPITNINEHQLKHIEKVLEHGAIAFIIVRWTTLNQTFLLDGKTLINFIRENERKSIPYEKFQELGHLIKDGYIPRLNYLLVVETVYFSDLNKKDD